MSATTMSATEPDFIAELWELFMSTRLELAMFFSAMAVYFVLHSRRVPISSKKLKSDKFAFDADESADSASCNASNKSQDGSRMLVTRIKTALRANNFTEVAEAFDELKASWSTKAFTESPSEAPRRIVSQVVELACREHQLHRFLPALEGMPLTEEAVNSMLIEGIRLRDCNITRNVEELVRKQDGALSDATYSLLIKAFANDIDHARAIVYEATARKGNRCCLDLVSAVLGFCAKAEDLSLADQFFEQLLPHPSNTLSVFIRFYLDIGKVDKACDIFEQGLKNASCSGDDSKTSMIDARVERSLLSAALRCGRTQLANTLLKASPSDIGKHITMIQNCASANNLDGAFSVFESLEQSGTELNSVVYNSVLEACVQCRKFAAAETWMTKSKEAGMADVVSYNTLIKAHLLNHNFSKARGLIDEMKQAGLQPNRVTYNELINSVIVAGGRKQDMWDMVREMNEAGIQPNQVTCSILLKNLNAQSSEADVSLTMDIMSTMEDQMDEVLLSSVVEACGRIGKPDLLSSKLKALQGSGRVAVNGAHTFGSLIKAYGHAGDVDGVWRCWKEMRSRHIKPSSITLGCMVEAVVRLGDTDGAYDLVQQIQDDDQCKGAVNAVIYCSVLKGFAREKKLERVWSVYEEMDRRGVEMSIVTYNTLLDACARVARMDSLPRLLQDMRKQSIKPNLISFSTMIKGHCQNGDIQAAFALVEQMKNETSLKPDEIMYNSLLDGCAQHNLIDEALTLLKEMQAEGVQPSNFTLSVLVKVMNRGRRVDQAFSLVNEICTKYHFKPNVHVYTNLIQACISNRQVSRAMETLETMVKDGVQPEGRTYTLLVRAHLSSNNAEMAVALTRGALGLAGAHPIVSRSGCATVDHSLVNETLNSLVDRGFTQALAVPLLTDIKSCKKYVRVDNATQSRVMSSSMGQDKSWGLGATKGKGKGRHS
jgi:pentatricopeptide repeat protein